jgi:competence protein ComEA
MSPAARAALVALTLAAAAGLTWRAVHDPPLPATAPPPCARPVAVAGAARAPGVVCLGPDGTAAAALRAAGARCPASRETARVPVAAGDLLTVAPGPAACRVEQGRLPALALRTLRVPIDPNNASEAELRALPGVGPALARRIVESRRDHGPFGAVEELRRVRGVGPQTLARLRGRLAIETPAAPATPRNPLPTLVGGDRVAGSLESTP